MFPDEVTEKGYEKIRKSDALRVQWLMKKYGGLEGFKKSLDECYKKIKKNPNTKNFEAWVKVHNDLGHICMFNNALLHKEKKELGKEFTLEQLPIPQKGEGEWQ